MNVEDLRAYCLSLGEDIDERMPFGAFKAAQGVLAFYTNGHIFCYFDIDHFDVVTVKCQPEIIPQLIEEHECITTPYNMSPKHWIGIRPEQAPDTLIKQLVSNSYTIIKNAYTSKSSK